MLGIAVIKILVGEFFNFESPVLLFFAAVAFSAWIGGAVQGVFATALSLICVFTIFVDPASLTQEQVRQWSFRTAFFCFDCFLITFVCAKLQNAKNKMNIAYGALKSVEGSLRQSENRLQAIFESNMVGILVSDMDGNMRHANDYFLNLLGVTQEELKTGKMNWMDFTPPEYREASRMGMEILKQTGSTKPFEKEYLRRDGTRVFVLVGAAKTEDNHTVAFALDITDKKRAADKLEQVVENRTQQLRQSESFLDSMIENIPNMIFVKDAKDLRFVRFNKAGEELLGASREQFMGKSDYDFFPKEQADFFTSKDRHVIEHKSVYDIPEEEIDTPRGKRLLHTKKIPIFDKFGEPQYLLGISEDITEHKEAEKQRIELYQAQAASRAKSAFLANISHEIRTPLGAMLGFAELALEDQNSGAEHSTYIATIIRNGRQLLRIVDEILDLSKVESDRIQIEKIKFSLNKLIEDVTSLLTLKASEKGLSLVVTKAPNLPEFVVSDPFRLRQILINVIGNAIKFSERGTIEVNVKTEGKTLDFTVKDSGIGIAPENAEKLFQPFMQADDSMTRKFGGTGLGLFLSRKLANLLGGELTLLKSAPGVGSEFRIRVEYSDAPISQETKSLTQPEEPKPKQMLSGRNILVVDDAADNRALVGAFLNRMGLHYDTAENGRIGVKKALSGNFDVVLMDLQMPEMDGFEAMRSLRDQSYFGPVIALTAHAMKGDREKCLQEGFDGYLYKPLTRAALAEELKRFIKPSQPRPPEANA